MSGKIRESVRLLTIWGGFVAKPGPLAGVKAGADTYDALTKLAKRANPRLTTLGEHLADQAEEVFRGFRDAPPDAEVLYAQMIAASLPDAKTIAGVGIDPGRVVDVMLKSLKLREHRTPEMQALFRQLIEPLLAELFGDPEFFADLQPAAIAKIMANQDNEKERATLLLEEYRRSLGRELELAEMAVIQIARRVVKEVPDFYSALAVLDTVVGAAENLASKGATPSNHPNFVDQVFGHVTELNSRARFGEGIDAFDEALRREEEESSARKTLLLEGAIEQAIVAGDACRASGFILNRLRLEDTPCLFQALRKVQDAWFERGRDNGNRFDLDVSIHLAHLGIEMADGPVEELAVHNDLAIALRNKGELATGPEAKDFLRRAVQASRTSLSLAAEADQPYQWAMFQQTIGNTLRALAERHSGSEATVLLADAVDAFHASIRVRNETDYPVEWASIQLNLAGAHLRQGQQTGPADRASHLSESVSAYKASLRVFTRAGFPNDWAMIQQNLAVALKAQAEYSAPPEDLGKLTDAVDASRSALRVITKEDQPVRWAMIMTNCAGAEIQIADHEKTADPGPHLKSALVKTTAALTVVDPVNSNSYYQKAVQLRGDISARLTALDSKGA